MKPNFKTAAQLGILPEERKALIAFVEAPALGRVVSVNGHAHYYDQAHSSNQEQAETNECGTAGCVAGFIFAHARAVQGKRTLRGARNAQDYLDAACESELGDIYDWDEKPIAPLLNELFRHGEDEKLAYAKKVVVKALKTGRVDW